MNFSKSKNQISEKKLKFKKDVSIIRNSIKEDWVFLICFLLISLIGSQFFSWNLFKGIQNDSFLSNQDIQVTGSLKVNTDQLDRVVSDLNSRKEQFDILTGVE